MAVPDKTAGPSSCLPLGRVENLSRTYSRLRDLACLPKDLVLYLARHECGTKICREKGIEYARRLLGHTRKFNHNTYLCRSVRPEEFHDFLTSTVSRITVTFGKTVALLGVHNSL